jgi:CheY-like chemotaxis protein
MLDLILCVDDDPITLMLCTMVLKKAAFAKEIITSKNGKEALNYFDTLKLNSLSTESISYPELIFLDLNMPVMDGWEFLSHFSKKEYTSSFKNSKVIVLSSTIDPEDILKSKQYPMVVDFFSKPITKEMLELLKIDK